MADWKRWKWGYWLCLILLGVINVIKQMPSVTVAYTNAPG